MALGLISRIRGERVTIGIDVGHYSIKYVKVFHNHRGGKIVMDADLECVPEGAIINGELQHRSTGGDVMGDKDSKREKDGYDMVGDALTKLLLRHPVDSADDVVISVNCGAGAGGVLVDRLSVKVPRGGNEAAIILQTCQTRPPFDDQDNILDYEIVSREGDEVKVNVVAAKNVLLDSWAQFFKLKGLNLSTIDVDIFGMLNAYMLTASEEDSKITTAIFNIGEKKMSVAFIQHGQFHSVRAMTGGSLDTVVSKICSTLGIDSEKCHKIFETGDMSSVDGYSESDVESAFNLAFDGLMAQVEFGIRYFSSAEDSEPLDKIVIGGGGASIPGLKAFIADRTGITTDTINPFKSVECDSKVFGEGLSLALSNIYAPALGLAMRKF